MATMYQYRPGDYVSRVSVVFGYLGSQYMVDKGKLQDAVEEFQCDYMGPDAVYGVCGIHTQAKVKEVHGC